MLLVVIGIAAVFGLRRFLKVLAARRAIALLEQPAPAISDILSAADHGRAALEPLFRWLGSDQDQSRRAAAGAALSRLWRLDQLVAEEEKALLVRAYEVRWNARRTYPRDIRIPIPIEIRFGTPVLHRDDLPAIEPDWVEWSYRVLGARRAGLELDSPWAPTAQSITFSIIPADFAERGPHRLIFAATARTAPHLSTHWETKLPQVPFTIEFDPALSVVSIQASPDDEESRNIRERIELAPPAEGGPHWHLGKAWALDRIPTLQVLPGRPRDLAHRVSIEWEQVTVRLEVGTLIQPADRPRHDPDSSEPTGAALPIAWRPESIPDLPSDAFSQAGPVRFRLILEPDPHLAWADPRVRSLWPGSVTSPWCEAAIMRV
jgi:hypothetical protein